MGLGEGDMPVIAMKSARLTSAGEDTPATFPETHDIRAVSMLLSCTTILGGRVAVVRGEGAATLDATFDANPPSSWAGDRNGELIGESMDARARCRMSTGADKFLSETTCKRRKGRLYRPFWH